MTDEEWLVKLGDAIYELALLYCNGPNIGLPMKPEGYDERHDKNKKT